jgi:hypothetical protein
MKRYTELLLTTLEDDDTLRQVFGFKKRDGAPGNKSKGMKAAEACRVVASRLFLAETYPFSADDTAEAKEEWEEQKHAWTELNKQDKKVLGNAVRSRVNVYVLNMPR